MIIDCGFESECQLNKISFWRDFLGLGELEFMSGASSMKECFQEAASFLHYPYLEDV
jgi:hypothetical protein